MGKKTSPTIVERSKDQIAGPASAVVAFDAIAIEYKTQNDFVDPEE